MHLFFFLLACQSQPTEPVLSDLPVLPQKPEDKARVRGVEQKQKQAILALVGEVRGEIEPCGCPTLPFGGFERRHNFLKSLPTENPIFHLDAGELLLKGFSAQSRKNIKDRADLLLQLSQEVGVDAMSVGPSDISAVGVEALQSFQGFPLISASFTNQTGDFLFSPSVVLEKKGFRIGVIGLSEQPTDPRYRDSIRYIEPEAAVRKAQTALPNNLDLVIALGGDGLLLIRVARGTSP